MLSTERKQLHADFGLMVTGLSLKDDLSKNDVLQIEEWIDNYSLIVFPSQHLNDQSHLEFTRKFQEKQHDQSE